MSRCFGFRACLVFSFHMFQSWLESSLMKSDRVFNLTLPFSLRWGQTMLRRQIESESQQTLPENEGNTEIHLPRMQAAAVCSPAAVTLLAVCVHLCKRSSNLQFPCDRCQGPFPIHLLGGSILSPIFGLCKLPRSTSSARISQPAGWGKLQGSCYPAWL